MSKRQAKTNRKVWYKIVESAILSQKIFSITKSKYGSRYIYEEIAHYLLRDSDETAKCKSFNYYCRKVKIAFPHAVAYLESEGVPVLKGGKSNRLFRVTIDKSVLGATEADYDRTEKRVEQAVVAAKAHVEVAHPRRCERFNKSAQQLLLTA